MMKDSIHLICNEFSRGIGHDLDWWKYRLSFYENFTLNSIVNQTNKNFYLLMTIDHRLPLKIELEEILKRSGLKYLLVNKTIKDDLKDKMSTLVGSSYVYTTRIDTDDVFHKDVVDEIQRYEYSEKRTLIYQKGYCYDVVNNRLQHYFAKSPPFSTSMFTREIFVDDSKRNEYIGVKSHDQLFKNTKSIVLSENKYIVLIHNRNLDSVYLEGKRAENLKRYTISENEHNGILKDFNIDVDTYKKAWKK